MDLRVSTHPGTGEAPSVRSSHRAVRLHRARRLLVAGAGVAALTAFGPATALAAIQTDTHRSDAGDVRVAGLGHVPDPSLFDGLALLGPVVSPSASPLLGQAQTGNGAAGVASTPQPGGEGSEAQLTSSGSDEAVDASPAPRSERNSGASGDVALSNHAARPGSAAPRDERGALSSAPLLSVWGPVVPWSDDPGGVRQSNVAVQETKVGPGSAVGALAPVQTATGTNSNGVIVPGSDDPGGVRQSNVAVQETKVGPGSAVGALAPVQTATGTNSNGGVTLPVSTVTPASADAPGRSGDPDKVRQSNAAVQETKVGPGSAVGVLAPVQVAPVTNVNVPGAGDTAGATDRDTGDSGGVQQCNAAVQETKVGPGSAVGALAPVQTAVGTNANDPEDHAAPCRRGDEHGDHQNGSSSGGDHHRHHQGGGSSGGSNGGSSGGSSGSSSSGSSGSSSGGSSGSSSGGSNGGSGGGSSSAVEVTPGLPATGVLSGPAVVYAATAALAGAAMALAAATLLVSRLRRRLLG